MRRSVATLSQLKQTSQIPDPHLKLTGDTVAYEALRKVEIYENYIRFSCEQGHMSKAKIDALLARLDAIATHK